MRVLYSTRASNSSQLGVSVRFRICDNKPSYVRFMRSAAGWAKSSCTVQNVSSHLQFQSCLEFLVDLRVRAVDVGLRGHGAIAQVDETSSGTSAGLPAS